MEKLKIEYIPIAEIIPYENNPRKNDNAVEIVKKSIQEFGFNVPIILDQHNMIIAGHTRLKAAKSLGLTEVPIIWVEHLTEEQIKAFRIMDNKSSEYADWDLDLLRKEIEDLKSVNYDVDLTGFNKQELENINKYLDGQIKEVDENIKTDNECPKCGYKF